MQNLYQSAKKVTKISSAMNRLQQFMDSRETVQIEAGGFETFEKELHRIITEVEREALASELSRYDIDMPVVEIGGVSYRRVVRCSQKYQGVAGSFSVTRSLYSNRQSGERAVNPMELQAGIIEGYWTPSAARQASYAVAHLTPHECEKLFGVFENMKPSKSSLDRLPRKLNGQWEKRRKEYDTALCAMSEIPDAAVKMAVSLDGVMIPMKDGKRKEKRVAAERAGKRTRGPAGNNVTGRRWRLADSRMLILV